MVRLFQSFGTMLARVRVPRDIAVVPTAGRGKAGAPSRPVRLQSACRLPHFVHLSRGFTAKSFVISRAVRRKLLERNCALMAAERSYTNPHIELPTLVQSRRAMDMILQG